MDSNDIGMARSWRRVWRVCTAALLLALPLAARAQFQVADCTQAGIEAALTNGGTFTFVCDGIITISNTLKVTTDTTLDGSGHRIVFSGLTSTNLANAIRLFHVNPGVKFELINFTLANGHGTNGAAIFNNRGVVTVRDCAFSNNVASAPNAAKGVNGKSSTFGNGSDGRSGSGGRRVSGGAIYNHLGTAYVTRCFFVSNHVVAPNGGRGGNGGNGYALAGDGGRGGSGGTACGGAIFNVGQLWVTNSSFFFNRVEGGDGGGGGTNGSATRGFTGYLGSGGSGGAGAGGAIYNTNKARAVITGSTFALNNAFSGDSANAGTSNGRPPGGVKGPDSKGGAICNVENLSMLNCTFFANRVTAGRGGNGGQSDARAGDGGDGGSAWGGNIYNGKLTLATNCTFYSGGATGGTNGIAGSAPVKGDKGRRGSSRGGNVSNGSGKFYLKDSIIAFALPGTNGYGAFSDRGHNISSDRSIRLKGSGSSINSGSAGAPW